MVNAAQLNATRKKVNRNKYHSEKECCIGVIVIMDLSLLYFFQADSQLSASVSQCPPKTNNSLLKFTALQVGQPRMKDQK